MALLDDKLVLCDAQDIPTAVAGSANSTNYIDLGDANQMPGRGTPLVLNVIVNTAFAGSAGSKLKVSLQDSTDGSTWASKLTFAEILASAAATPGVKIAAIALPQDDMSRYINLALETSTGMTSGKLDAWIGLDAPRGPEDTVTYGAISGE